MISEELWKLIVSWLRQGRKVSEIDFWTKGNAQKVQCTGLLRNSKKTIEESEKAQTVIPAQSDLKYGTLYDSTADHRKGSSFLPICFKTG